MYLTPEQIHASNKANIEAILSLATTQFAACEKFAGLSTGAFKALFEDSIANARALAGAKDAQEMVNLQNGFAQPAIEKAISCSRNMYEVATHANAEASKIAERRFAEWKENLASLLDRAAKNAPAGSEVAVLAARQMLAAANSAYDNFSKVARHATEIADESVTTTTETVKSLAKAKKAA